MTTIKVLKYRYKDSYRQQSLTIAQVKWDLVATAANNLAHLLQVLAVEWQAARAQHIKNHTE